MSLVFSGCKDESSHGSVVDNSNPENYANGSEGMNLQSDMKIEEGETVSEKNLGTDTELFMSNSYYLEGTIYSGGEVMPVKLATDGTNIELTATLKGLSFGVLVLDDQTYAIQPQAKVYTELSDLLVKTLGIDDLNVSEFQSIRDSSNEQAAVNQIAVTINGEPGICTDFVYSDTSVKLYSVGDKLVQVENFDNKGTMTMQIVVDSISAQIPADQLSLKGLTKQNIPSFLSSFVG